MKGRAGQGEGIARTDDGVGQVGTGCRAAPPDGSGAALRGRVRIPPSGVTAGQVQPWSGRGWGAVRLCHALAPMARAEMTPSMVLSCSKTHAFTGPSTSTSVTAISPRERLSRLAMLWPAWATMVET